MVDLGGGGVKPGVAEAAAPLPRVWKLVAVTLLLFYGACILPPSLAGLRGCIIAAVLPAESISRLAAAAFRGWLLFCCPPCMRM